MVDAAFQRVLSARPSLSHLWHAVRSLPGGPAMFSRLVSQLSPHSAGLGARVHCLEEGLVEVVLRDRRGLYDMNGTIHAAVLVNLAELVTGLALRYVVDRRGEARLRRISLEVLGAATGEIRATCEDVVPTRVGQHSPTLRACLRNREGEVVANATSLWDVHIMASG